ncbi:MAG: RimK/LysX family protein [Pseudomonadota bacterium]|nr:RimK/LysX family protein [Pseudomonadota bacterium]MDQ3229457.1 RimK/LysX family protein [Pseudomonadota bacterium]
MSQGVMLGWREWVALPQLAIPAIRAKVDTGARTSALHVDAQWRFVEGGAPWVGFRLTPGLAGEPVIESTALVLDERVVRDSGGKRSTRVFVRTQLALAGCARDIEINLTDRAGMRFPMLLGRTALAGMFTVDPAVSFLHGRRRRPK